MIPPSATTPVDDDATGRKNMQQLIQLRWIAVLGQVGTILVVFFVFRIELPLLYMFAEAGSELAQEQITRVLLERLIVNRPHPWGLLITFIELIKNPRYNFWAHSFTRCAPDIERLFESVARSCIAPQGKPEEENQAQGVPVGA